MDPFRYAYLIANIFFFIVWFIIFWRLKAFRPPMLIMSLIAASFGPISELWYFADYWNPEVVLPLPLIGGIEDMLFGFSIGGIGAFIYESLFVRYHTRCGIASLHRDIQLSSNVTCLILSKFLA